MMSKQARFAYLCLAPSTLFFLGFIFYPIAKTILWSFCQINLNGEITGFVGLDNFIHLWHDPIFWQVLRQTFIWVVGCVGCTTLISILVAVSLNEKFPGRKIARSLILLPWAFSLPMSTVVWRWIFNTELGMLNRVLVMWGIISENNLIPWLAQPVPAFCAILIVGIWVSIPFTSIVLLSGLQSIPDHLYEASRMDGATRVTSFFHVTLPLLKPTLVVVTLLNVIYVFNSFPIIWILTQGRPVDYTHTLITFLYKRAFIETNYGSACAMAVVTFFILMVFSIWSTRSTAKNEQDISL